MHCRNKPGNDGGHVVSTPRYYGCGVRLSHNKQMTSIDTIVARLTKLHPKLIDLSLDRMWRILAALGEPQRRLPPAIHVAGTNGKGSTIAFMRAILEAAGLRVVSHVLDNGPDAIAHE